MKKHFFKSTLAAILTMALLCISLPTQSFAAQEHGGGPDLVYSDGAWYPTGCLPEEVEPTYLPPAVQTRASLPTSVDLSTSKYFPPILNQTGGSCASFATAYYAFTYESAKLKNWDAKSNQAYCTSPWWAYTFLNKGDNNGTSISDNCRILKAMGGVKITQFPVGNYADRYTDTTGMREALSVRISDWDYQSFASTSLSTPIQSASSSYLTNMKQYLADGHIIVFGSNLNLGVNGECITQTQNGYGTAIYRNDVPNEENGGGHAMTIVGYNDSVECVINGNKMQGAFKMANSWGTGWQNSGYCWIMYDALNKVSALPNMPKESREPILRDYGYYTFSVDSYTPNLVAEINIQNKVTSAEKNICIKIGSTYVDQNTSRPDNSDMNTASAKDFVRIWKGASQTDKVLILLDCGKDTYALTRDEILGNKWFIGIQSEFATTATGKIKETNTNSLQKSITVSATTSKTFWKETSYILPLSAASYEVDGNYIMGVDTNTNVARFMYNLGNTSGLDWDMNDKNNIYVCDPEMKGTLTSPQTITTGNNILNFSTGETLQIVVLGDIDGNGKINVADMTVMKNIINGSSNISGANLKAADIDRDGDVDVADMMALKNMIMS